MDQLRHNLRILIAVIGASASLTLLLAGLLVLGWYIHGGRLLSVQTDSMTPMLRPGDAVIVSPVASGELHPGEIVSYRRLENPKIIVTHRIVALLPDSSQVIVKGDSLSETDPPVPTKMVVGRVDWYAPRFGKAVDVLHRPLWLVIGGFTLMTTVLIVEIRSFVRHYHFSYRLIR